MIEFMMIEMIKNGSFTIGTGIEVKQMKLMDQRNLQEDRNDER